MSSGSDVLVAGEIDDEVVLLDGDGVGFGGVGATFEAGRGGVGFGEGGAGFDFDLVAADADFGGVEPGLAGADVEFPAVPGAADDLALAAVFVLAGGAGGDEAGELADAERAALVGAAVAEGEVFAAEVEDADGAPGDLDDFAPAGGDFARFGDELPPEGLYDRLLVEFERPLVAAALAATNGNQVRAADLLGLNRNTLRKKIRELGIRMTSAVG